MQKVAKEYVEDFLRNLVTPPKASETGDKLLQKKDIFKLCTLMDLIKLREGALLVELSDKTKKNPKEFYEVWMMHESDLIQELAMTFGERVCLEETTKRIGTKE